MTTLAPKSCKTQLRVSVIVPCCSRHVRLLPELLDSLSRQTRKPDEIILAVSGITHSALPSLDAAQVICDPVARSSGWNRNRGSEAAVGEVFIYQDADDVPHPQRVQLIAHLFETYEVEHLMHGYLYRTGDMAPLSIDEAATNSVYSAEPDASTCVTNGNVSITRSVFDVVKWPERLGTGEDQEFNREIYRFFKRTVTTRLQLLLYRHDLSSFR